MFAHVLKQVGLVDGSLGPVLVHKVSVDLPMELELNMSAEFQLPDKG